MGYRRIGRNLAPLCLAALLAGCGQVDSLLVMDGGGSTSRDISVAYGKREIGEAGTGLSKVDDPVVFLESAARIAEREREYDTAAKHWANLAALQPDNMGYARSLAASLRVLGRHEDAERVLRQALREKPDDIDLNEEMAKTLVASGRLREGVGLIERLAARAGADRARLARLRSASGVAFDRAGEHAQARAQYALALEAEPHDAAALNNLGLSYAMSGDLAKAEETLREALVAPDASTQVRQNLGMILALKGRSDEARRLVGQDLPPGLASRTVGYYGRIADRRGL